MRVPPYPLSLLRTPACPGFGVFGDRKSSCFDRSGGLGSDKGESGLIGHSGDAASKRLYPVDRNAGAGSGSFERVQMGRPTVSEIRISGDRPKDGSCPGDGDAGWPSEPGLFERVQMRKVTGESPMLGRSVGAAAAAPFERVQMSLPGDSGYDDYSYSRRRGMQLQ